MANLNESIEPHRKEVEAIKIKHKLVANSRSRLSSGSPWVDGWIMFEAGNFTTHENDKGLGIINGVNFQTCCDLLEGERIKDALEDIDFAPEQNRDGIVEFRISDIEWFPGQMSFPETGQWDIPPDWWFEIKITKVEYFPFANNVDRRCEPDAND